jgi:hypothetical protein
VLRQDRVEAPSTGLVGKLMRAPAVAAVVVFAALVGMPDLDHRIGDCAAARIEHEAAQ